MSDKYISVSAGGTLQEVEATQVSSGAGDAGKILALNSSGQIDLTTLPTGVGPDVKTVAVSEAVTAGNLVNIWYDNGTVKVRKADASGSNAGKSVDGFVLESQSNVGQTVAVYFEGVIPGLSALTPGATYYLSGSTAGGITTTAPTDAGYTVQLVGKAISATELNFEPQQPIVRA